MLLFKVINTYKVEGKGLLLSGKGKTSLKGVDFQSDIKLVLPDKSEIRTSVVGINWNNGDVIVSNFEDFKIPNGTEVWLVESKK